MNANGVAERFDVLDENFGKGHGVAIVCISVPERNVRIWLLPRFAVDDIDVQADGVRASWAYGRAVGIIPMMSQ